MKTESEVLWQQFPWKRSLEKDLELEREPHNWTGEFLSVFSDKVIEASWMAIVAVVPLFFNVYNHRSFEPDKTALVRSIARVMELAWVIKELEARS